MKMEQVKSILDQHNIAACHWRTAMDSVDRIVKLTGEDGDYWLKKAAPARGIFRYHALNFFSWMMRLPLLKAVPQPGGNQAIANEVNRIKQLAQTGVLVPEILAYNESWLLIKDVGQSIIKKLKQKTTAQTTRQALLQTCLDAIKALHQNQQYLSQGFIRNMLINESGAVTFIDFEDDPMDVMSLAHAQARDVLLLVNSTARFFIDDAEFFNHSIKQFITGHDPEMIAALRTTTNRMQWITRIPFQGLFGHDYQKLKTGILSLKNL